MRSFLLANKALMVALDAQGQMREIYFPLPGGPSHSLGRPARLALGYRGAVLWLDQDFHCRPEAFRSDLIAVHQFQHRRLALSLRIETWIDDEADQLNRIFHLQGPAGEELLLLAHLDLAISGHDWGDCVRAESEGVLHHKGQVALLHRFVGPGESAGWTLGRRDLNGGVAALAERAELDRNPCAVGAGESLLARRIRLSVSGKAEARLTLELSRESDSLCLKEVQDIVRPSRARAHYLQAQIPKGLSPHHAAAFEASLAHLSAFFSPESGAMIASPDSSGLDIAREHYGYVWPRDAALCAITLMEIGLAERADRLLGFCQRFQCPEGYFHQRLNADGSPASSWHPRRNEKELLPIQSDETALVALATAKRLLAGGEDALYDSLLVPTTDFLLRYRDEKSGLPRPSHDLWEERFGLHTFTITCTIAALENAALVAQVRGQPRSDWLAAAQQMRVAQRKYLFHEELGRYARRAEIEPDGRYHLDMTVDSALAALFLFDDSAASRPEVQATMAAVEEILLFGTEVRGVARYEDDHYHRRSRDPKQVPGNPWLISTLWLARWRIKENNLAGAAELIDAVLELAAASGALPEQVHPFTGESVSVQPLAWSHSEMLSTLLAFAAKSRKE